MTGGQKADGRVEPNTIGTILSAGVLGGYVVGYATIYALFWRHLLPEELTVGTALLPIAAGALPVTVFGVPSGLLVALASWYFLRYADLTKAFLVACATTGAMPFLLSDRYLRLEPLFAVALVTLYVASRYFPRQPEVIRRG